MIHENISCCFLKQIGSLFVVVYKAMHSRFTYVKLLSILLVNPLSKQFLVFAGKQLRKCFLPDGLIKVGGCER